jgi:hypothetical protein
MSHPTLPLFVEPPTIAELQVMAEGKTLPERFKGMKLELLWDLIQGMVDVHVNNGSAGLLSSMPHHLAGAKKGLQSYYRAMTYANVFNDTPHAPMELSLLDLTLLKERNIPSRMRGLTTEDIFACIVHATIDGPAGPVCPGAAGTSAHFEAFFEVMTVQKDVMEKADAMVEEGTRVYSPYGESSLFGVLMRNELASRYTARRKRVPQEVKDLRKLAAGLDRLAAIAEDRHFTVEIAVHPKANEQGSLWIIRAGSREGTEKIHEYSGPVLDHLITAVEAFNDAYKET